MNVEQDAANLVVNQTMLLTIEATKMLLTLSGKGAVRTAAMLTAVLQEQHKTKGAARLATLLKSGGNLEIFTIPQDQLKAWAQAAKNYGILYTVIKDPANDGMVDLIVHTDDAPRINRIVERHGLVLTPEASITAEPAPEQELAVPAEHPSVEMAEQETEAILAEILAAPEEVKDETSQVIEETLEPDVPEDEFNALFQDDTAQPRPDLEDPPGPRQALLSGSPSGNQFDTSLNGGSETAKSFEVSSSPRQGNEWTLKRVKEEWPFAHPREAFNDEQRFEIYKGFSDGLSINQIAQYAKPEIFPSEMAAYRTSIRPSVIEHISRIRTSAQDGGKSVAAAALENVVQGGKEL